jgi:hypothetical protein
MLAGMTHVKRILSAIEAGDPKAAEELLPLVYGLLAMHFSPEGKRLATIVSERGPIKLSVYDVGTGKGQQIDAHAAA